MNQGQDSNFLPAVKCPHCGKTNHPSISGWGGELSTRTKACHFCGRDYRLLVYTWADPEVTVTTALINDKLNRIKYLKNRIYEKLHKVTNKTAEWAEESLRVDQSTGGRQN